MKKHPLFIVLAVVLSLALLAGCSRAANQKDAEREPEDNQGAYLDDFDPGQADDGADHDEGKTKGGDPIESINGKSDASDSGEGSQAAEASIPITVDSLLPELNIPPENLLPDEDFSGVYANEDYTALITKGDEDRMTVVIRSAAPGLTGTEWTMSGYFSDENYRIRYSNAVKANVSYSRDGEETGRQIEYENGSGVIQFSDSSHFAWLHNMEPIDRSVFVKSE